MSEISAWMPLYIGDYLADTMDLNSTEHGAYLLLIMHYWRSGPLPDDDRALAAIARTERKEWTSVGPIVRRFFRSDDGKLHHKRIDAEKERATEFKNAAGSRGRAGAAAKWGGPPTAAATRSQRLAEARRLGTHTDAEWRAMLSFCRHQCVRCNAEGSLVKDHIAPIYQGGSDAIDNLQPLCIRCNASKGPDATDHRKDGWQRACKAPAERVHDASAERLETPAECLQTPGSLPSLSPSPSSLRSDRRVRVTDPPEFEQFWRLYPRKDDKGHARKAFAAACKVVAASEIIAGVGRYQFSPDPKFQPLAATWLHGERWSDQGPKSLPLEQAQPADWNRF